MKQEQERPSLVRRAAGSALKAVGRGYFAAGTELTGERNNSAIQQPRLNLTPIAQPGLAEEAFPAGAITGTDGRLLRPATSTAPAARPAGLNAENVAPAADAAAAHTPARRPARAAARTAATRNVDNAVTHRRRSTANNVDSDSVVIRGVRVNTRRQRSGDTDSEDTRNRGHHVNWAAVSGLAIAGAIVWTGLRGNGGVATASASGSPDHSGTPTGSLNPSILPSASASETLGNVSQLDVQTLIKLLQADPKNIHAGNWALNFGNWSIVYGDNTTRYPGAVMAVDTETGQAHLVSTLNTSELQTTGQGYTDAMVPGNEQGNHQELSWVLAPDTYMPLKQITEWPVQPGQTPESATETALQGQAALEANKQPNVCTLEVTQSLQAIPENTQDLSNAPEWQPDTSLTPDQVAQRIGITGWAIDGSKWHKSTDGFGYTLDVDPSGMSSVVDMQNAIGQAYVDNPNPDSNGHNVTAVTLGDGTKAPIRQVTVYLFKDNGQNMSPELKQQILDYAFKQHVMKELGYYNANDAQLGVYVVKVPKTICPIERQSSPTSAPTQAEITAKATAAATEVVNTPWYKQFVDVLPAGTTSVLSDGGLKIKENSSKNITIPAGYEIIYWDGTKTVTKDGPVIVSTAEGTIYKTGKK